MKINLYIFNFCLILLYFFLSFWEKCDTVTNPIEELWKSNLNFYALQTIICEIIAWCHTFIYVSKKM